MHRFYQGAQAQMVAVVQEIERTMHPQLAFAGAGHEVAVAAEAADGLIMRYKTEPLKLTQKAAVDADGGLSHVSKGMRLTGYIPYKQECELLAKIFNNTREFLGKRLHFNFEHIFEGEVYSNGAFGGFHHDYLGYGRLSGAKIIKDIKGLGNGFYKGYILDNRGEVGRKIIFS